MIIHHAPDDWKVRGFDKWTCGKPMYSHESGSSDSEDVTCHKCLIELSSWYCHNCAVEVRNYERCKYCGKTEQEKS
jgi:hypothetical protein